MSIPVHVNLPLDFSTGLCLHKLWPPPLPAPLPNPVPSWEVPTIKGWLFGILIHHVFTKKVLHKFYPIVLEGHDCGILIPDLTIPPLNLHYPFQWPISKRKIVFSTSIVKMDKKKVGCTQVTLYLPMLTCGYPMALPTSFSIINFTNTVIVGMTVLDLIIGLLAIAVSMLFDLALSKVPFFHHFHDQLSKEALKYALKYLIAFGVGKLIKAGQGKATDFSINSLSNNPTFKVSGGAPKAGNAAIGPAVTGLPGLGGMNALVGSGSTWGGPAGAAR